MRRDLPFQFLDSERDDAVQMQKCPHPSQLLSLRENGLRVNEVGSRRSWPSAQKWQRMGAHSGGNLYELAGPLGTDLRHEGSRPGELVRAASAGVAGTD